MCCKNQDVALLNWYVQLLLTPDIWHILLFGQLVCDFIVRILQLWSHSTYAWSLTTHKMFLSTCTSCFLALWSKYSCSLMLLPPTHLHLTTSKVMVIVWRLKGNIIGTVLYIANVLPLQWAQLTKTVHTARLGLEFVFLRFFRLHDLSLCSCMFCFTLDSWVISLHSASEMTYIVSGGALNSTHSLISLHVLALA